MKKRHTEISATFTGTNSIGYITGRNYRLKLTGATIERVGGFGRCEYESLNAFFANWTDIKPVPKTVKSFDGKTDVNVASMQKSLRADFPSFCQKDIDDFGTPFLSNCVHSVHDCGCSIIGNGTIQFPLSIQFCSLHKTSNK